ncbi:MAG: hypothetical protein ABSE05_07805 [Syntrophales bacterium]|jgi:hypothetical protein
MKKFKNLVASDFPGVDAQRFGEWKAAVMRMRGIVYMVLIIYLVLNTKSYGSTGNIIYDTPIVILIGILLLSQQSRFVSEKHSTYIIMSLCFLILFNIILVYVTGRFVGESLIVIVALFWLYNQSQKNKRLEKELGIDSTAMKRALSK